MYDAEFENDISIIVKSHALTINRSKKEIKLILIYHMTYEVIEIKIYDNSLNKLLGREILTYSDIFQIFNNYFICFNENMQKIYDYINNSIGLKKYEIYLVDITKTISLEIYILKENNINAKSINITSCDDEEKYKLVSQKIKELNCLINIHNKTITVAPFLNCIKYENNIHCLYMDLYIEKEIEILAFKAKIISKNNNFINLNKNNEIIYSRFYSRDDIIFLSKYYESISNINEVCDDIKINLANKNLKIDSVTDDKIKITLNVLSSINKFKITFELIKGLDIKDKYIQIIKDLKIKNEYLANNVTFQNKNNFFLEKKSKNKNNTINNNNETVSNNNKNIFNEKKNNEKKIIGKKRKRLDSIKKTEKNNGKKDKKNNYEQINNVKNVFSYFPKDIKNENLMPKNTLLNLLNNMSSIQQKLENEKLKLNLPKIIDKNSNQKNNKDEHYLVLCNKREYH